MFQQNLRSRGFIFPGGIENKILCRLNFLSLPLELLKSENYESEIRVLGCWLEVRNRRYQPSERSFFHWRGIQYDFLL